MVEGGANETVNGPTTGPSGTAAGEHADGPQELSRAAAVVVTVLAAVFGAAVLLAVFHWLGWSVPWIGWIVAKAGIKLAVGGFAGLAVGFAWLRARLRARNRS
ncbi:hypothetical protein [Streptomyces sp. LS1784]|uniref:hypothetical protein n=1 Tax=Streptomyces sp. LS1784 TaxID=2851533 RepID=UPI001CCC2E58|nr:hypothetical protein [Streptomyces sp. LS1784]